MIAYTEDPQRRAKDLEDIHLVLSRYEAGSDRLFSDAVFEAELADFSEANAFLLGLDLRQLASNEETAYIGRFLAHFPLQDEEVADRRLRGQLRAFETGFKRH